MNHCSDANLRRLLARDERHDIQDADGSLFLHLDTCTRCQRRLSQLSGDGAWLGELVDSVSEEDVQPLSSRPSSVVIALDRSDPWDEMIDCEVVSLDFLDKPSHPELLGRLGRYDIERMVGVGGFGIVFKARDSELNRVVALKCLAPHLMSSGPAKRRFAREAQAAAAVVHDHVIPIYDVVSEKKSCYLVMQFVAGQSLQERVDQNGPLPPEDVLRIACQTAAGLEAAHAQGLIHRDVKPANILLKETVDRVVISDFGLARSADDASLTRSGAITGTPHYMSPEQARGDDVDQRSDLFSLGSVLYFMCTGRSPFRAPQMMAVLHRICHTEHRPVGEVNTQIPHELAALIHRLLAKSPAARFQSAGQVRVELQRLLSEYQRGGLRLASEKQPARQARLFGIIAAVALSIISVAIWRPWPTTPTPEDTTEQVRTAIPASPPEDTFASELTATISQLEQIESKESLPAFRGGATSTGWDREIVELHRELDDVERNDLWRSSPSSPP